MRTSVQLTLRTRVGAPEEVPSQVTPSPVFNSHDAAAACPSAASCCCCCCWCSSSCGGGGACCAASWSLSSGASATRAPSWLRPAPLARRSGSGGPERERRRTGRPLRLEAASGAGGAAIARNALPGIPRPGRPGPTARKVGPRKEGRMLVRPVEDRPPCGGSRRRRDLARGLLVAQWAGQVAADVIRHDVRRTCCIAGGGML